MKICLFSPTDLKGGASKVAYLLTNALRERSIEADLWVNDKFSDSSFVKVLPQYNSNKSALKSRLAHRLGINKLSIDSKFPKLLSKDFFKDYDLIHLHDLPKDFNYLQFPWLTKQKATCWTIHCMAPFTGNCLFSYDCDRWQRNCGDCPQYGKWPLNWYHRDGSALNIQLMKQKFRRSKLHSIGVSTWISDQIKESHLGSYPITTIHNPVDSNEYYPEERTEIREKLGIPENAFVVMFSTGGNIEDNRKGLDIICEALKSFPKGSLFLLPCGISGNPESLNAVLDNHEGLAPRHLSSTDDLRAYYSAADIVWHPTRADTSSMVSLEAFACETTVIAAEVGGVPEIVQHEKTGLLINKEDPVALVNATKRLMNDDALLQHLSMNAKEYVKSRDLDSYTDQHISLYESML